MALSTAHTILKVSIAINMLAGGLLLASGSHPTSAVLANHFFDLTFWPWDQAQSVNTPVARLAAGLGGGAFFGWGVACWIVATQLFDREPAVARNIILFGTIAWFLVDSTASLLAGAPANVVFNGLILISLVVPLLRIHTART